MKKYWFKRGLFRSSTIGYKPISEEGWLVIIYALVWIIVAGLKTGFFQSIRWLYLNTSAIFWFFINLGVVIVLFAVIARGKVEKRKKK